MFLLYIILHVEMCHLMSSLYMPKRYSTLIVQIFSDNLLLEIN